MKIIEQIIVVERKKISVHCHAGTGRTG